MKNKDFNRYNAAILGLIVGDALGVPVEFKSRGTMKDNLVTDMMGYGTHNQPAGIWFKSIELIVLS